MDPLLFLCSLFAPFLLWPLEYLLPYPHVIEELLKAVLVYFIPKNKSDTFGRYLIPFALAGTLFALSETVLYIININLLGKVSFIFVRFLATSLLHSLSFVLIAVSSFKNRKLIWLGLILAIFLHYLYNQMPLINRANF